MTAPGTNERTARLRDLLLDLDRDAGDDELRQVLDLFAHWSYDVMHRLGEGGKRCALCGEDRPHIHWLKPEDKS